MATDDWPFTPEAPTGGWSISRDEEAWGRYQIEEFKGPDYDDEADAERAHAEEIADVNLIAAAPRMYRALKAVIAENDEFGAPDAFSQVRDVVDWIDGR